MDEVTRPSSPGGGSAGDPSRLRHSAARRSSLRFGRNTPGIPPSRALSAVRLADLGAHVTSPTGCSQPVDEVTRPSSPGGGSAGDPSRLRHSAARRSSLRFGRNTPGPVLPVGAPPSRALSAVRLADLGAHVTSPTGCSQPVDEVTRPSSPGGGSSADSSRLNRAAAPRSSLRFGRNTLGPVLPVGAPPSRALSAGRLAPTGRLVALGARATSPTGC